MKCTSVDSLVCYIMWWMETKWTFIYRKMSETLKVSSGVCAFCLKKKKKNFVHEIIVGQVHGPHCAQTEIAHLIKNWRVTSVHGCSPDDLHQTQARPALIRIRTKWTWKNLHITSLNSMSSYLRWQSYYQEAVCRCYCCYFLEFSWWTTTEPLAVSVFSIAAVQTQERNFLHAQISAYVNCLITPHFAAIVQKTASL